jgi:hypothetical protein
MGDSSSASKPILWYSVGDVKEILCSWTLEWAPSPFSSLSIKAIMGTLLMHARNSASFKGPPYSISSCHRFRQKLSRYDPLDESFNPPLAQGERFNRHQRSIDQTLLTHGTSKPRIVDSPPQPICTYMATHDLFCFVRAKLYSL